MKSLFWRKVLPLGNIDLDTDKYVLGNYKNSFMQW